jgi:predicted ATPase/tRNA A37 threonylcarbamoyladenosine biosynthesis protein TsaE
MVEGMAECLRRFPRHQGVRLAVQVGIHTGVVVVSTTRKGEREQLILGDTPTIAARIQDRAAPDTVVVSLATLRLVEGYFDYQALGAHMADAHGEPLVVYQILEESTAQRGLTRLVGREHELGLLCERWTQVKDGLGQVVLLSGEAGIGKSRLVQALKEHLAGEAYTRVECRCSPYYQNTALYPVVTHVQRRLRWHRGETSEEKLRKLEEALQPYGLALAEVVPLLATLLSLPLPDRYVPLTLTPQRQKHKTLEVLLAWLLAEVERQPMCFIVEDLHWADASTLEWLSLLIEQVPTTRLFLLLIFRPDFRPPWAPRSYLTPLSLGRLSHRQVETMTERVTERILGGTPLPAEVLRHVIAATDGVPLFIEELTKMILESGLVKEREGQYALRRPLPALAIPATLYESLMARLDQWEAAKPVAQLGAVVGREFTSEMLQAVWPGEEDTLQQGLAQLVNAELLYRRGVLHQALYVFKHALIQEAAYQSLLRSTRQQYHQQIARVLEARFPDVCEAQPELLAHHYTQAGLTEQAVGYWQRAGQRALQRSAYVEAMTHLTRGLELLKLLPETVERLRQEFDMQMSLGAALRVTRGQGAPEVEQLYIRGRALCERVGEPPQLFRVLWGLWTVYQARGAYQTMRALGQQLLSLAQRLHDPGLLLEAYHVLWTGLFFDGEITAAQPYLKQGLQLYEPQRHCTHIVLYSGHDSGVCCRMIAAQSLWLLGYPDQAVASSQAALALAQQMAHPYSLDFALRWAAVLHHLRREAPLTQARAEAAMTIATEQGFPLRLAQAMPLRGWALAARGYGEEGRAQIEQGLAAYQAAGVTASRPYYLALLAEASAQVGQTTVGLEALAEALAMLAKSTARWWEAELYRLRGELLRQRSVAQPGEAEACFQQSLAVARRQQAKSLELRATMSLSRLWQHQGKRRVAHDLLAPIYGWFTEGFDTADLREAKALLEVLA